MDEAGILLGVWIRQERTLNTNRLFEKIIKCLYLCSYFMWKLFGIVKFFLQANAYAKT